MLFRSDLRAPSIEHLQRGDGLRVLELNGVTAESAHIYHPGTPLLVGYAAMFRQWALAFRVGAARARDGAPVTGPVELLRRFVTDLARATVVLNTLALPVDLPIAKEGARGRRSRNP